MDKTRNQLRMHVVGVETKVPVIGGNLVNYINFDNAASTPPFKKSLDTIMEFSKYYSNIHRGSGFKSEISTAAYEEAKRIIMGFIGADVQNSQVIFTKNSTEAINRLANCLELEEGDIVISTTMEHHSNDLPWREKVQVEYAEVFDNGELDLDHFTYLLRKNSGKVKLVTVTAASNVTGYINPIHKLAIIAHQYGAKILVDASQLMAHRRLDMKPYCHEEHLDFVVFTGHKMYAPFGIGVLVGPKALFNKAKPDMLGGGTIKVVLSDTVYLAESPERHEAGTPNIIGAIGLAAAIKTIEAIGMDDVIRHENKLTYRLLSGLTKQESIKIYGCADSDSIKRLGTISFSVQNMNHALVAAILSYEYGIGARNGCFCAHPYVLRLLNIKRQAQLDFARKILEGDKSNVPGLVRVSLGLYNTIDEVDRLLLAMENIRSGTYYREYVLNNSKGTYMPEHWNINTDDFFKL